MAWIKKSSPRVLGDSYTLIYEYLKAIDCYQAALDIREKTLPQNDLLIANTLINLGNVFVHLKIHEKAYKYYKKAEFVYNQNKESTDEDKAMCYLNIGNVFRLRGDYIQALNYFEQSLLIRLANPRLANKNLAQCYGNIATVYAFMENGEKAIEFGLKSYEVLKQNNFPFQDTIVNWDNMGVYHRLAKKYDKAIEWHKKVLALLERKLGSNHPSLADTLYNIGYTYQEKRDFEKALEFYDKSTNLTPKSNRIDFAFLHCQISMCKEAKGQLKEALQFCHKALIHIILEEDDKPFELYELPPSPKDNALKAELLTLIYNKSNAFYNLYLQSSQNHNLLATLAYFQYLDKQIDELRKNYKAEASKLLLAQKSHQYYCYGLNVCSTTHQLELQNGLDLQNETKELNYNLPKRSIGLAFHFAEKNKSVLLLNHLKNIDALLLSQLPDKLVEKMDALRSQLLMFQLKIDNEKAKEKSKQNTSQLAQLKSQFFDHKQAYDRLIAQMEKDHPKYYELKYHTKTVSINQLQKSLSADTCLIEYFVGEKYIYVFTITNKHQDFIQLIKPDDFEDLIADFIETIHQHFDREDFITLSWKLYERIALPATNAIADKHIQKLIIIPDGTLAQIPFEALLTKEVAINTKYKDLPYLIKHYEISYHLSATLWYNELQQNVNQNCPYTYIGFAPSYTLPKLTEKEAAPNNKRNRNLGELLHTKEEVLSIAQQYQQKGLKTKAFLSEKANKDNFCQESGQTQCLLVAGHSDIDEKHPELSGIVFLLQ